MASPAQILTNQQNSQHSTGPRSPEGKRTSSLNATRHGLTSQLVLLPNEDAAPYEGFRTKLLAELAPEGTIEQMLAQSICETQWRIERARKHEANILALPYFEELPAGLAAIEDPEERAAMIEAYAVTKYEKALRNLHIQEGRLQRTLTKTLADLRQEKFLSRQKHDDDFNMAINARTYHQSTEQPFHPEALGFVFTTAEIDREIQSRYMQDFPFSTTGLPPVRTKSDRKAHDQHFFDGLINQVREQSASAKSL